MPDALTHSCIMLQMANSAQAWEGMTHTQVITKVALEQQRLPWPAHANLAIKVRNTAADVLGT